MKKIAIVTLALSALLQSCGQKGAVSSGTYKNTVKLGKFSDTVTDPTFDKIQLKDLPRSVNLKKDMSSVKNQSDRGSCTFFSTTAMLEATVKKDMGIEVNLSEEYLNYATKSQGFLPFTEGSDVLYNIYAVRAAGLMLERDSAYQPTWFSKGLPCEKYKASDANVPSICFSHNAPDADAVKKILNADNLDFTGHEKKTNELIRYLAEERRPLVVSIPVNFNGWPESGDTFYNEDLRKECLADPDKCGGHSILLTGYDLNKGVFFFKNSWGASWGQQGYGTITIETIDKYAGADLYSAKLNGALKLPEDYNADPLSLKSFSFTTTTDNQNKLAVNIATEISGAKGHLIYISSFLSKKNDGVKTSEAASDDNTHVIQVTPEEAQVSGENGMRAFNYITNPATDILKWTKDSPLALNFLPGIEKTYNATMGSSDKTFLRTTIYVHTDDSSYKVLKRIYTPIAK